MLPCSEPEKEPACWHIPTIVEPSTVIVHVSGDEPGSCTTRFQVPPRTPKLDPEVPVRVAVSEPSGVDPGS